MKLTLDVFKFAGRNGMVCLYNKGVCEFDYSGYKYKADDEEECESFTIWDEIKIKFIGKVKIDDVEFCEVSFYENAFRGICVAKNDVDKLKKFCEKRNQEMLLEKKSICTYVDEEVLDIAENLVNIIEEDVMLNWRIIIGLHKEYSQRKYDKETLGGFYIGQYFEHNRCHAFERSTYGTKGKEKAALNKQNEILHQQYWKVKKVIDNFVEIVVDEKGLEPYVAKAVAWEAVTTKIIEYYGQKWHDEYASQLEMDYDEICDNSDNENIAAREYIKEVISCGEIDIDSSMEILMYYLLYKRDRVVGHNLLVAFDSFYNLYKEIKEEVNSQDIKNKLKTKQKRRISKYTIDDVDLMTGAEFEEFVGLLFKKMGYSSQVTKQSGDQGLDVIATKNGTKIGVQAKCYSNTVGNSAVQEAVAGKSFYNCDKVIVITNNYFTPAAEELAQSNGVILWNRDMLKEKIKELM